MIRHTVDWDGDRVRSCVGMWTGPLVVINSY